MDSLISVSHGCSLSWPFPLTCSNKLAQGDAEDTCDSCVNIPEVRRARVDCNTPGLTFSQASSICFDETADIWIPWCANAAPQRTDGSLIAMPGPAERLKSLS